MNKLEHFYEKGLSRRNFLVAAGAAGTVAALTGCNDAYNNPISPTTISTTYTDVDILNFALNLEYLESEFYLRAATGNGLAASDISGVGTPGSVTGGAKVPTTSVAQQEILNEIAYDEQEHVRFLRSALGSAAIARPAIDFNAGFSGAVAAANSLSAASATLPLIPTTFSPFASYDAWLVGGFTFEDVGVTAYLGAAPLISAAGIAAGFLNAAAGILAVEGYHASVFRTQLTGNAINQGYTAYPYPLYANRVANLRAALGGGAETLMNCFLPAASTVANINSSSTTPAGHVVNASVSNAVGYSRSTDQVLHIVYGTFSPTAGSTTPTAGVGSGGFFPNGVNGNIKVTLS